MSDRLQPAIWGGLFIGVLSALPLVNAVNCCCCLWVLVGGALAAYLRQQNNPYQIDAAEGQLPPLRQFILPGGTEAGARLHLARTVCRRAERLLAELAAPYPVEPAILTYVNRLSDWLFVHARLGGNETRSAGL